MKTSTKQGVTILLALLLAASPSLQASMSDDDMQRLHEGEVVVKCNHDNSSGLEFIGVSRADVTAAVLIDAPIEAVWEVIDDKEAAPEYTDGLVRADVVQEGDVCLVEQEMKVPKFPGTFVYTIQYRPQPPTLVEFEKHSGDLKEIRGSWQLQPVSQGEQTLLVYKLHLKPGMLIPQSIVNFGLKRSLPNVMTAVRERVLAMQ